MKRLTVFLALLPALAFGQTLNQSLFIRSTQTNGSGISGSYDLSTSRGAAAANSGAAACVTARTTFRTYASIGTVSQAMTLNGTVTLNGRGLESSGSCNNGNSFTIYYYRSGSPTQICQSAASSEWTTSETAKQATCTASSVGLQVGDYIEITWEHINVGTGNASYTKTLYWDGPTSGASGDAWINLPQCVPGVTATVCITNSGMEGFWGIEEHDPRLILLATIYGR